MSDTDLTDDGWVPIADCKKDTEVAEVVPTFQGTTGWEYRAIKHEDGKIRIHSCSIFNDVIGDVGDPVDFNNIDDIESWVNEINWAYRALTKPVLNMKAEEI